MKQHLGSFVVGAAIVAVSLVLTFTVIEVWVRLRMAYDPSAVFDLEGWVVVLVFGATGGLMNMIIRWADDSITWKD